MSKNVPVLLGDKFEPQNFRQNFWSSQTVVGIIWNQLEAML